jgi:Interferon-induced 6-16 family
MRERSGENGIGDQNGFHLMTFLFDASCVEPASPSRASESDPNAVPSSADVIKSGLLFFTSFNQIMSHGCQYCLQPCDGGIIKEKPEQAQSQQKIRRAGNVIGTVLLIGGAAVALPCVAVSLAGFGAAGIVGGSMAAAAQSAIGNVAAGSLFAVMQSAGATGLFVNGMFAGGTAAAAGAAANVFTGDTKNSKDNQGDGETKNDGIEQEDDTQTPKAMRFCPYCGRKLSRADMHPPQVKE